MANIPRMDPVDKKRLIGLALDLAISWEDSLIDAHHHDLKEPVVVRCLANIAAFRQILLEDYGRKDVLAQLMEDQSKLKTVTLSELMKFNCQHERTEGCDDNGQLLEPPVDVCIHCGAERR